MMWVFLIVVIGFGLAWAVVPRKMWRITQGWQYKNPEANEPSDAAYAMWRISSIVAIVVIIVAMLTLISNQNMTSKQREGERSRAAQERAGKEKYEVEEVQLSVFAMQARKVFGVPGSTAVIGYPHEGFLRRGELEGIKHGQAPAGWLPYDNEHLEPGFLRNLRGTYGLVGRELRWQPGGSTDLVAQLPSSWLYRCEIIVYAVTETEGEIQLSISPLSEGSAKSSSPGSCSIASPNVILLDIDLQKPVGDRRVVGPDGAEIPQLKT